MPKYYYTTKLNRSGNVVQMRRDFLKTSCAACGGVTMGLLSPGLGGRGTPHAAGSGLEYRNYQPYKMTYARLGKTNFMVSSIALGGYANSFPENNDGRTADSDPAAYQAALQRCLDRGINYFDTAHYFYFTEPHFAYLCHPDRRKKLFLSSKLRKMDTPRADLEATLKAMNHKDGWVDIYYMHHVNYGIAVPGSDDGNVGNNFERFLRCLDEMDKLVAEGRIRHKGITTHNPDLVNEILTKYGNRVDVICVPYGPSSLGPSDGNPPTTWDSKTIHPADSLDVGVVSMKSFLGPNNSIASK